MSLVTLLGFPVVDRSIYQLDYFVCSLFLARMIPYLR
jgi:hypothetical protein